MYLICIKTIIIVMGRSVNQICNHQMYYDTMVTRFAHIYMGIKRGDQCVRSMWRQRFHYSY